MSRDSNRRQAFAALVWLVLTVWLVVAAWAGAVLPAAAAPAIAPQELAAQRLGELQLRFVGPVGNRVPAVVGVPGDPNVYYAGAASGGIWKSEDGGLSWQPIFDRQAVSSIGSLAIAPSDPNVVWAGTGETFIRSNVSIGTGIYRSTDAGRSWQAMGLEATGRIGRIVIHPSNSDIVFAAALGHAYGPQKERGIYRTTDGGKSWRQALFVDEQTGAIELVMDPNNPRILFAATWQIEIRPWGRESGGPGSGIFASRDGGDTWTRLSGHGLPPPPWGKVGLAMSKASSARIYALIETDSGVAGWPEDGQGSSEEAGVLWRSDDGGANWQLVSRDHNLNQRPLYYSRAAVAPDDADEIHFMAVDHSLSIDGGRTIKRVPTGGDHHDIWIDPLLPDRMIVGHDGGLAISTTRGASWLRVALPVAQMYHVATDDRVPYNLYGNRQDGSSYRGPSRSWSGFEISPALWRDVGGCESGWTVPEPAGDTVYTGCYDGVLDRYDDATGSVQNIMVWPEAIEGSAAADMRYRFQWTFPVALSPHHPGRVYAGSQHLHASDDRGRTWREISPDLTKNEAARQVRSGGLTFDDSSPTVYPTLFAIAESPLAAGLIWVGTNDGQVQLTRDDGATWKNVTAALPSLPGEGTVANLEPSRFDDGTVYATIDRHQLGDPAPYVLRSRDFGAHWQRITGGLPGGPLGYAHCVREDPVRRGMLYLGTERGLYLSFDDGEHWQPLQLNLPPAPVSWITVQERFQDLVVATYGRGFWVLDDVSPLRTLGDAAARSEPQLFAPQRAYRLQSERRLVGMVGRQVSSGSNPPYGALLSYWLPADLPADKKVEIEVLDRAGAPVRRLADLPTSAGLHRVAWDLRGETSTEVELRTPPLGNPHLDLGPRGTRELIEAGRVSVPALPGTYIVRLKSGDTVLTQPLEVVVDPRVAPAEADLVAQHALLSRLAGLLSRLAGAINRLEWTRKQLADLDARLASLDGSAEPRRALAAVAAQAREVEGLFFDLRMGDGGQDFLRWPRRLYGRTAYLFGYVDNGDYAPTASQSELTAQLEGEVAAAEARVSALHDGAVAALNRTLYEQGIGPVVVTPGGSP